MSNKVECQKIFHCNLRVPCSVDCEDYVPCLNVAEEIEGLTKEYKENKEDPLDIQIGGDHYKNFAIQPIEYTTKNNLGFIQGDVIKRMTRYNLPTGKGIEDLEKSKHEIDVLIKFEKEKINNKP